MASELSLNAKYVVNGTADIRASGQALSTEAAGIKTGQISNLDAGKPAGTDDTGNQFEQWYHQRKDDIAKMMADTSEYIVDFANNADMAVASFVKTDLDSADALKIEGVAEAKRV